MRWPAGRSSALLLLLLLTCALLMTSSHAEGRAALQRIDHVERTISPPMLLSKVLQFLTYYG